MTALIIGLLLIIGLNFWSISNLKDECKYWKNQAVTSMSGKKFGRRLEVERELLRNYHKVKAIRG